MARQRLTPRLLRALGFGSRATRYVDEIDFGRLLSFQSEVELAGTLTGDARDAAQSYLTALRDDLRGRTVSRAAFEIGEAGAGDLRRLSPSENV